MKALVLWGDPHAANFGIRVLFEGTKQLLCSVDPSLDVDYQHYGWGTAPFPVARAKGAIKRRFRTREAVEWLRQYSVVVDLRAGDSFTDIYGLKFLAEQSLWAEFVAELGIPLIFGPMTVGPFRTRAGRLIARANLSRVKALVTRDSYSAGYAEGFGRPADAVGTDVVFALPRPERPAQPEHDVLLNVSGLLWSSDAHGDSGQYQTLVRDLIRDLREAGRSVTLLSHDVPDDVVSDARPGAMLAEEFGLVHVHPESLDQVRKTAASARLAIGSRMHMCLNSLSVGTPAVPLAYSRKFAPLLRDLGWEHTLELGAATTTSAVLAACQQAEEGDVDAVLHRADLLIDRVRECYASVIG
ncbi:polysaccharide pyruvyl transferase family protein [Cutibacterium equinum]|uniref:Polysaccharide pyruvyl transferase family protein n=1 Tax=Cutibacterium equinum TaxID=3016342 RepID=A0ABY7R050_9ACTN|nr:polysaccharide pyruvyl transferase family protein [Cutibacterium equinum]WCC80127.1 polysaccharide pyruvyl transferase family protein [Cutibacterium equinum]